MARTLKPAKVKQFGSRYLLLTDSQDIASAMDYVNPVLHLLHDGAMPSFLLVLMGDAEYLEIWASFRYSTPYMEAYVWPLLVSPT